MRPGTMKGLLTDAGYAEYADLIEAQAQRCLRFDLLPIDESEIALAETKLGGSPDLPDGIEWPDYRRRPLDFICQINLGDLSPYASCKRLPPDGILYFFYDAVKQPEGQYTRDRERWSVIHHPGPMDALKRVQFPDGNFPTANLKACRVDFYEALSPGWEEIPVDVLHLDDNDLDEYMAFIETLPTQTAHQLLGRSGRVESFERLMQLDCQFVSNGLYLRYHGRPIDEERATELEPGATDWKLLLQLDSDGGAGINWDEGKALSFWIREPDLERSDFSRCWVLMDGY